MLKKLNPKKILSYALLATLITFIFVLTWVPLMFDVANLDVDKWFTNVLVSGGIMILSIILGEILGEDRQKEKVGGLYQTALIAYYEIMDVLTNVKRIIIYFSQFFTWFKARELKIKKEGHLVDHGFDQMAAHQIVMFIERDDLDKMRQGPFIKTDEKTGRQIKFLKITDEQYEAAKEIFSGDFTIDAPNYTYYLSAFGDSSSVSTLEQAKRLEKKERLNKTFNRTFKILLSLFISFIWGMATIQELTKGGAREAVANTFSRTIALVGGLLSGVITSVISVKLMAEKLKNKTQVLKFMEMHYDNGEFVPKSYDELVDEQIEAEKKRESEAIDPEVLEPAETAKMIGHGD